MTMYTIQAKMHTGNSQSYTITENVCDGGAKLIATADHYLSQQPDPKKFVGLHIFEGASTDLKDTLYWRNVNYETEVWRDSEGFAVKGDE